MDILKYILLVMVASLSLGIEDGHDFESYEELKIVVKEMNSAFKNMEHEITELKKVNQRF